MQIGRAQQQKGTGSTKTIFAPACAFCAFSRLFQADISVSQFEECYSREILFMLIGSCRIALLWSAIFPASR
jgi:hypothetical protein